MWMFGIGLLVGVLAASGGLVPGAAGRDRSAGLAQGPATVAGAVADQSDQVAAQRERVAAELRGGASGPDTSTAHRRAGSTAASAAPAGARPGSAAGSAPAPIPAPTAAGGMGTGRPGSDDVARAQVDTLAAAGLAPVHGPALTVQLDDAPREGRGGPYPPGIPSPGPDDLVVHQQDVQAVVNALWAGGAEAMSIMDRRVTSLTAVRCVGNTLLLDGEVFSPPFRITAIGDVQALRAGLAADPQVVIYRQYVDAYRLGYRVDQAPDVRLPGYDGPLDLTAAGTLR